MYNIIYQFKYYAPTSTIDGSAQQTQKKKKKVLEQCFCAKS